MRAWITRDKRPGDNPPRELWLHQPGRISIGDDCVVYWRDGLPLSDDQFPQHQPQPGECIELNIEQVPVESAPSHRGKDVEVYP